MHAATAEATLTGVQWQSGEPAQLQTLALDGPLRGSWTDAQTSITLQPGLRWKARSDPHQLAGQGTIDTPAEVHIDAKGVRSDSDLPFAVQSPQWGEWSGVVQRLRLHAGIGLGDWNAADANVRFKGQLKQWRQAGMLAHDLRAAGTGAVHWSRTAGLQTTSDFQANAGRITQTGASPLRIDPSRWTVTARAKAKAGGDLWQNLVLEGHANSGPLKARLPDGKTLGTGPTRVTLQPSYLARKQGELLLTAPALRYAKWPATTLQARLRLASDQLRGDGTLKVPGIETLRFSGSHAVARGTGQATLTTQQQPLSALAVPLKQQMPKLQPLGLQAGALDGRMALNWRLNPTFKIDAKGTLVTRNATIGWEKASVEAADVTLRLDGLQPLQGRLQFAAPRGHLANGTPLTDLNLDLALAPRTLTVHAAGVKAFGGRITAGPQQLPWPATSQKSLPVHVQGVDLGELLALFDMDDLSATGRIEGVMPLGWRNGAIEIRDGKLASMGKGTLRYTPKDLTHDNLGLQALRNFHYDRLGADVSYTSEGDYRALVALEGNNPDFYNGYPVRMRMNIGGNLPGLFRAALFSGDFSRHILQQLQSGKLQ